MAHPIKPSRILSRIYYLVVAFVLLVSSACIKIEPRRYLAVKTIQVSNDSVLVWRASGMIIDLGENEITQHGFSYATDNSPDLNNTDSIINLGSPGETTAPVEFTGILTGLDPNKTYYVRAFATDSDGSVFGEPVSFTTQSRNPPTVISTPVDNITDSSAVGGGNVTDDGGSAVTARGVCWSTSENPTIANDTTMDGEGTGIFTSSITGLICGTKYYVRAYATNGAGTAYGDTASFTTSNCTVNLPAITTTSISNITDTSALSGGNVTHDGGDSVTARGVCWSTTANPTIADAHTMDGTGAGTFSSELTGLIPDTSYYVRAYATNSAGTAYGNEQSFHTLISANLPAVSTTAITNITETTAQGGGNVTDDGGVPVTAKGVCWSNSENPTLLDSYTTDGIGTGAYMSSITGLSCDTTYYLRAYATNSAGTSYGDQVSFATSECTANPPGITTKSISDITDTSAVGGGNVTDDGGSAVTVRGVCWSTSENPTIANDTTMDGAGTGSYSSTIKGLTCGTTYYVKAYASNASGTSYGAQVSFTSSSCPPGPPDLTTAPISNIMENSAQCGGNIITDGGAAVTARGVCWSTSPTPTISDSKTNDGSGTGSYTSSITGLSCGITYFVRAYATNSVGTSYGNQISFITNQCDTTPTLTSSPVTGITSTSAEGGGNVTSDGGSAVTARGVCWSTSEDPTISDNKTEDGTGTGSFTSSIMGLTCGTDYYLRAYATNASGTAYGDQISFSTGACPVLATVTTLPASNITENSAQSGGEVTDEGGASVTERGVCWSTSQNPEITDSKTVDGTGTGSFASSITGLSSGTVYYVRAYATNIEGTAYGNEVSFIASTTQVVDYDGNIYNIVTIGTQTWMAENLKVTHYADGSSIPLVENASAWGALGNAGQAYCWYDNSTTNRDTYGGLYTWAAAMNGETSSTSNPSGVQGVCPAGWHLPSDVEWTQLTGYLGGTGIAGGKLKEAGLTHWASPNEGATNESGFTALPGGYRMANGPFGHIGNSGYWWSSSEYNPSSAWDRQMSYSVANVGRLQYTNYYGLSVRCVRDQ